MAFDLASISTLDADEAGADLPVLDPRTNTPAKNEAGEDIVIRLRSALSRQGQRYRTQVAEQQLDMVRRGQEVSVQVMNDRNTEMLTMLTKGWNFDVLDGAEFPFTPDNAKKLWGDERFLSLRESALQFVNRESNFLKR